MSKGIVQERAGGVLIAGGIAMQIYLPGYASFGRLTAKFLIEAGVGLVLSGIGTMLPKRGAQPGFATTTRNPTQEWEIVYGRTRRGGTLVCLSEVAQKEPTQCL